MKAPEQRLLRGKDAAVEPFYPPARLMHGVQFDAAAHAASLLAEAEALRAAAEQERKAAEVQAAAIVAEARAKATSLEAAAVEQGRAAASAELAGLLGALSTQIEQQRRAYAARLADTAFLLARTVLAVELTLQPSALRQLVQQVLAAARDKQHVDVHVAPDRLDVVTAARAEFAAALPNCTSLRVVADAGLRRDAVRVCTERGVYAASVRGELRRLRRDLGDRVAALLGAAKDEAS